MRLINISYAIGHVKDLFTVQGNWYRAVLVCEILVSVWQCFLLFTFCRYFGVIIA